jgi:DNA-directed RNA polymerase I subunit RPA12
MEAIQEELHRTEQATVEEDCPKCGHGIARFTTAQLRSADEGSTVFYTCVACGLKWRQNN